VAQQDPDQPRNATKEEICNAYSTLTEIELARLEKAGKYALWGTN
jgi:hypothetical protein